MGAPCWLHPKPPPHGPHRLRTRGQRHGGGAGSDAHCARARRRLRDQRSNTAARSRAGQSARPGAGLPRGGSRVGPGPSARQVRTGTPRALGGDYGRPRVSMNPPPPGRPPPPPARGLRDHPSRAGTCPGLSSSSRRPSSAPVLLRLRPLFGCFSYFS
ncbi:hypothetical protein J1605_016182 [Eschrichtius robustus]|uniref:Uncharacterized protein n=1 Tax=Eschrichtius robustus TaxID=9764 RepID=A0AB34G7Q8_ESCRO|nr:hypothetical protein J1605_016182 [Eschrichtius robustus]